MLAIIHFWIIVLLKPIISAKKTTPSELLTVKESKRYYYEQFESSHNEYFEIEMNVFHVICHVTLYFSFNNSSKAQADKAALQHGQKILCSSLDKTETKYCRIGLL